MANTTFVVEFCNKGLVEACSKLRVESICKAGNGVSIFTNSITLVVELEVIKQWLNKTAGLSEITNIESHLSQFKYFLKVLDISY